MVIDLESVPTLDVSAARMLGSMTNDLKSVGVEVRLARLVGQVHDVLATSLATPPDHYPTIAEAVAAGKGTAR